MGNRGKSKLIEEITKAELLELLETTEAIQYLGTFNSKAYYRTKIFPPSNIPSSQRPIFRIVYITL